MNRKEGLELINSLFLGLKISLEKIPFLVICHLGNFDELIQSGFRVIPNIRLVIYASQFTTS